MSASWASSAATRASMLANRSRDTKPELAVRKLVHAMGLRYRVAHPPLPSAKRLRADLVFTRVKVAVFVDGCFWHGCPQHHTAPRANAAFWRDKVDGNRARDRRTDETLRVSGWTVLRFWEHEDPAMVATAINAAVRGE